MYTVIQYPQVISYPFLTENEQQGCSVKDNTPEQENEPSDCHLPGLVIYMVDPFTYGQDWDNMTRLSTLGLLRCYQEMLKALPEPLQQCTQLQVSIYLYNVLRSRIRRITMCSLKFCDIDQKDKPHLILIENPTMCSST